MAQLLVLVIASCIIAIALGRSMRSGRWLVLVGSALLIYLASLIAWWYAMYFQIVSFDRMLARLQIYSTEGLVGFLFFLVHR